MTICICIGSDKACSNECHSFSSSDGVNFTVEQGNCRDSFNTSNNQTAKTKLMNELGFRVDDSMNISTQFLYEMKRQKDEKERERIELNSLNEYLRIDFYEVSTMAVIKSFSTGVVKSVFRSFLKSGLNGSKLMKDGIVGGCIAANQESLKEQVYAKLAREAKSKSVQKEMINFMRQLDIEIDSHKARVKHIKERNY